MEAWVMRQWGGTCSCLLCLEHGAGGGCKKGFNKGRGSVAASRVVRTDTMLTITC
jgi:hypothetical protein